MGEQAKNRLFQNLANIITVFGLVMAIWLLIIIVTNPEELWLILILAGVIGLTDFVDGKIARRFKIESGVGSALDRLRDKVFTCPTLVILTWFCWPLVDQNFIFLALTSALVVLIIFLEALLLFAWFVGIIKKLNVASNRFGQRKMFCQFVAVAVWLISLAVKKYSGFPLINYSIYLINLILLATVYLGIKSAEDYYQRYK
jgi:CDP-diacylglycerol--glycerol-3-phosphate 3-phosphatidyltransferase